MPRTTYRKEPRFITRFTVRVGNLAGALDMMRYDSCYPATEPDANRLARIGVDRRLADSERVIAFIRAGRNASGPTVARWTSRGCEVLDVYHPEDENALQRERGVCAPDPSALAVDEPGPALLDDLINGPFRSR